MKKRLFVMLVVGTAFVAALPGSIAADISLTQTNQVLLSCNDGHSVPLSVDSSTLASLTADVQSINTSGSGLTCTLDASTLGPSSETTDWTVYDYNPSKQALAPRNSPNKMPASTPDGGVTWTFPFQPDIYTALFTTTDPSLTGNLTGRTLTDDISVSGDAASFMTQHNGGAGCNTNVPAAVRFYFVSPSASGSSVGSPPAGFYTRFWWSNPVHLELLNGNQAGTIIAHMSSPGEWSDWNGQSGANPAVTGAFLDAIQKVQSIGLSFGGVCFFETGVTPTDPFTNEAFSSQFSEN
jgi:hypothetical protein